MTAGRKGCNIDRGKATASRQVFSALVPGQLFPRMAAKRAVNAQQSLCIKPSSHQPPKQSRPCRSSARGAQLHRL